MPGIIIFNWVLGMGSSVVSVGEERFTDLNFAAYAVLLMESIKALSRVSSLSTCACECPG